MRTLFAIIKVKEDKFHFADTTKNEYLVYLPEQFNVEILTQVEKILKAKSKKNSYTLEEFGEAYNKAFQEWTTKFKRETVYMR